MKEKTLRIVSIFVITLAFVICMYLALDTFKTYLETGKNFLVFVIIFDALLAGVNAFNFGYNYCRWRILDHQKQAIKRYAKMIEKQLNSEGYESKIEVEIQEMESEEEGAKQ